MHERTLRRPDRPPMSASEHPRPVEASTHPDNREDPRKEVQTVFRTYDFSDVQRRQQELWQEAERERLIARIRRSESVEKPVKRSTLRLRALLAR